MEALSGSSLLSEMILVCPPAQIPDYYALIRGTGLDLISQVVGGENTWQRSAALGIAACQEQAAYYLFHDGNRPLVTPELADDCIEAAFDCGAAVAGVSQKDPVKQVNTDGFIMVTPEQNSWVALQTPQVFGASLYRDAMALAAREKNNYTNSCRMVERTGHKIRVIPGNYENMKITSPEDLAFAGIMLRIREEGVQEWQLIE